ncbi:MAG: PEGA domain-containing protein [Spirochaetaceae bacterium]|nr:PEGA domain-containing protein [Spirochaetaceae bacterium]
MNRFIKYCLLSCLLSQAVFSLHSQESQIKETITEKKYSMDNYVRSPLFKEQDLIYGRNVSFAQGLEIICLQDKVKAEISGYETLYTPVDLNNISSGVYTVKLSKTGYYPAEFRITISSRERTSVEVSLVPYVCRLTVEGLPENGEIFLNNQKMENDVFDAQRGVNHLRISAFGYEDYSEIIYISDENERIIAPELIKKEFSFHELKLNRNTIWLNDSRSQKIVRISLFPQAPGRGEIRISRISDGEVIDSSELVFDKSQIDYYLDFNLIETSGENRFLVTLKGTDGKNSSQVQTELEIKKGTKSVWRNNFSGFSGFLYSPTADSLPAGISQLQSITGPVFQTDEVENMIFPAIFSLRTAIFDNLEIGAGAALYISPDLNETSLGFFASGKYIFFQSEGSNGFSLATGLSVNYNGRISAYSMIPSYDPFSGLSGLSIVTPLQYRIHSFTFVLTPEFRFSPSYPGIEGGFSAASFNIWNYFRAAISLDFGNFSLALSTALQSPSYMKRSSQWPFFIGLDLNTTPGSSGFSFSFYGGMRYLRDEALQITSGFSAGFIF